MFYCQKCKFKVLSAGEKEEGKGTTNTEISLPNVSKTTDPKGVSVEHEERIALPDSKEDSTYFTSQDT